MIFNQEKNLIAWNKDILDTYNDIVISFDYTRYSFFDIPRGGFCVVFFDRDIEVPVLGGPGYSLGYTPSEKSDYCYLKGYNGFGNGFLGIGFDISGIFGLKNKLVDGLDKPVLNSVTVRGSEDEKYKHITTSKNLLYLSKPFSISEKYSNEEVYKTVKIIISKAFTEIKVQIKNSNEKEFYNIFTTSIPIKRRTGVKVGLTHTALDERTVFNIKNFNVAGFPGVVTEPELRECASTEELPEKLGERVVVSTNKFVAIPTEKVVNVYEIKNGLLNISQIIEEENPANLIGGNERFLFLNRKGTEEIDIYFNINNNFLKTQTISLTSEVDDIPIEDIGGLPWCAATDNKFLMIGNRKNVYCYQYRTGGSSYGNFEFFQTITGNPSGDIGYTVQIDSGKMLTAGGTYRVDGRRNSFVSFYENNGIDWNDSPTQTFSSPVSGNIFDEFGYSIAMQGNEAIIGSPNEFRRGKNTVGHGEAYHYVYLRTRKQWRAAMSLGNFYNIDSPGGNFGTSIAFLNNNLLISAPYENYHFPPDLIWENKPNCGRVYLFRKTKGGTFSQASVLAPDYNRAVEYMYFGKLVGLLGGRTMIVGVPYKNPLQNSELDSYKIGCVFEDPPAHKPIDLDSIALYDNAGYTIDMQSYTYLKLINNSPIPPSLLL